MHIGKFVRSEAVIMLFFSLQVFNKQTSSLFKV